MDTNQKVDISEDIDKKLVNKYNKNKADPLKMISEPFRKADEMKLEIIKETDNFLVKSYKHLQ